MFYQDWPSNERLNQEYDIKKNLNAKHEFVRWSILQSITMITKISVWFISFAIFHEDITQSRSEKNYWKMIVWHFSIYNFQGLLRKILFCWHLKSLKSIFEKNSHFFAPSFKVTPESHFSLFLSMIFNKLILFRASLISITQTFRNETHITEISLTDCMKKWLTWIKNFLVWMWEKGHFL